MGDQPTPGRWILAHWQVLSALGAGVVATVTFVLVLSGQARVGADLVPRVVAIESRIGTELLPRIAQIEARIAGIEDRIGTDLLPRVVAIESRIRVIEERLGRIEAVLPTISSDLRDVRTFLLGAASRTPATP